MAERGLNQEHFENVLDISQPLLPIGGRDETLYDHSDHNEVVFLDKECARNESYADHLRRELLLEQRCLFENDHLPGIVNGDNYYHFYLQWNDSNAVDCTQGVVIDFEAFCISFIEYEPILHPEGYQCSSKGQPEESWWMDDITGDFGDTQNDIYSFPTFDDFNLIVYVVDTYTRLDHDQFAYINNKEYLGDTTLADGSLAHHGTLVTGLIVGEDYGVIRDENVKLKVCSFVVCILYLPLLLFISSSLYPAGCRNQKDCESSWVEACLIEFGYDLESEQLSAQKKLRAVINMSLGSKGSGCARHYEWLFTQCMWFIQKYIIRKCPYSSHPVLLQIYSEGLGRN